ncbi:hypothetical protein C0J52_20260 [Blattella germanica]|nr:hypothetical protein C0J52_20260 [Blattella germanica]
MHYTQQLKKWLIAQLVNSEHRLLYTVKCGIPLSWRNVNGVNVAIHPETIKNCHRNLKTTGLVKDERRTGCPSMSRSDDNVATVQEMFYGAHQNQYAKLSDPSSTHAASIIILSFQQTDGTISTAHDCKPEFWPLETVTVLFFNHSMDSNTNSNIKEKGLVNIQTRVVVIYAPNMEGMTLKYPSYPVARPFCSQGNKYGGLSFQLEIHHQSPLQKYHTL